MVKKARGVSGVLILLLVLTGTSLMSCAAESQTISPVSNDTSMTALLASLPEPVERVPVAVYLIQDKTGQNLEMETYTSLSRAVSQGATDMMIHALVLSRQFKVADRSIFDQLMTEQDLQGMQRLAPEQKDPQLNQLMGSRYIIVGSVTEYGLKRTRGTRLSISGIGMSGEDVLAYAAIDIRVIDSTTGEAVHTISLRDDIRGTSIGGDIFRFAAADLLVDMETGVGYQEPINFVVRRLIETSVYEMCVNFFADQTGIRPLLDSDQVAALNNQLRREKSSTSEIRETPSKFKFSYAHVFSAGVKSFAESKGYSGLGDSAVLECRYDITNNLGLVGAIGVGESEKRFGMDYVGAVIHTPTAPGSRLPELYLGIASARSTVTLGGADYEFHGTLAKVGIDFVISDRIAVGLGYNYISPESVSGGEKVDLSNAFLRLGLSL